MTNNPYVIARLTANGPDYRGKLHTTLYMGTEPIDVLTNEAMQMLEPEFPAAELVSNALRHMGDRTLWAEVIGTGRGSPKLNISRSSAKNCSAGVTWQAWRWGSVSIDSKTRTWCSASSKTWYKTSALINSSR